MLSNLSIHTDLPVPCMEWILCAQMFVYSISNPWSISAKEVQSSFHFQIQGRQKLREVKALVQAALLVSGLTRIETQVCMTPEPQASIYSMLLLHS